MSDKKPSLESRLEQIRGTIREVWSVRSVDEQPELVLEAWSARKIRGACHLVGYKVTDMEGRVGSVLVTFDPVSVKAVTSSGRVYELRGRPGQDADAELTWNWWAHFNNAKETADVTAEVWQQIQEARK